MKVLVFTTLYPNNISPNFGVFIKERMTSFARLNGHRVKVVAPVPYFPAIKIGEYWKFSQIAPQERIEGLEVHHPRYFMTPKIGMSTYGAMMFASVLPAIVKIRREFDFDLIDAHYVYPDGLAAVLLGRYFKKPVVVSARGSDINLFAKFPFIRKLLRYTLANADHAIAVCQALKDEMVQLQVPDHKITVIPNGVDTQKFYPAAKMASRRELDLPDKRLILSVGELIPRKGFHILIKALKLLRDEYHEKDLYLVIIGEGKYRQELERLIAALGLQEAVRLAGKIPHSDLRRWYSAADFFCLASDREGWPNVVLEAMACGTPVIATNVWGIPEIIVSDQLGLLTSRNEHEMARTIGLALKRNWAAETISQYAREKTWDRTALSVQHVFDSILCGA